MRIELPSMEDILSTLTPQYKTQFVQNGIEACYKLMDTCGNLVTIIHNITLT